MWIIIRKRKRLLVAKLLKYLMSVCVCVCETEKFLPLLSTRIAISFSLSFSSSFFFLHQTSTKTSLARSARSVRSARHCQFNNNEKFASPFHSLEVSGASREIAYLLCMCITYNR